MLLWVIVGTDGCVGADVIAIGSVVGDGNGVGYVDGDVFGC